MGPSLGCAGETWTSGRACGRGISDRLTMGRGLFERVGGQEVGHQNTPGFSVYLGREEGNGVVAGEEGGQRRLVWVFAEFPERYLNIRAGRRVGSPRDQAYEGTNG